MLIETNDYLTIKNFAAKVKAPPNNVRHFILDGRIETIDMDGILYVHKDLIAKWPPQLKKTGRKPKTKG